MIYPESIAKLIGALHKIPGVGLKTAERYAFSIIDMPEEQVDFLVDCIHEAKAKVHYCKFCGDYSEDDICERCKTGDASVICVVANSTDIKAIDKTGYNGLYHVLHGLINFQKGKPPEAIRIKELIERLSDPNIKEVILATDSDANGELTAVYIANMVKSMGKKATRLAQGVPMGAEIGYADEITLTTALRNRKEL